LFVYDGRHAEMKNPGRRAYMKIQRKTPSTPIPLPTVEECDATAADQKSAADLP